jgi:hypothetical protein
MTTVCQAYSSQSSLTSRHLGKLAIDQIFRVINDQSFGTFDKNFDVISFYNWTGGPGSLSAPVDNEGNGEPRASTGTSCVFLNASKFHPLFDLFHAGLVATHHRPSDDISVFRESYKRDCRVFNHILSFKAFLTPANAMLSVELTNLADILDAARQSKNVSDSARRLSSRIKHAVMNSTVRHS